MVTLQEKENIFNWTIEDLIYPEIIYSKQIETIYNNIYKNKQNKNTRRPIQKPLYEMWHKAPASTNLISDHASCLPLL